MNIKDIDKTIHELENSETTFSNCEKLAHLYVVREHAKSGLKTMVDGESDKNVAWELSDIFPYYKKYCDVKREYQMGHANEDNVLDTLQALCRETIEFIHILYSSTDIPEERHIIVGNFSNLQF